MDDRTSIDERTDEELAVDSRAGDDAAFELLVRRYADRIFAFAFRMSGDRALAEDAAQETFLKAWKGIKKFDKTKRFRPWLFQIARNAATDLLRRRKDLSFSALSKGGGTGDGDMEFSDVLEDDALLSDAQLDLSIDAEIVERALDSLSPAMKAVVLLHDIEELTFQEIADISGESLNTVKSRYRRALSRLQEAVHQKLYP
jgi:RNA polymerase sigma-70 factor (ECF subfamily)